MVVYAIFTLFFLAAGINSAVVADHYEEFKDFKYYRGTYTRYYPPAVATTVTVGVFRRARNLYENFYARQHICYSA